MAPQHTLPTVIDHHRQNAETPLSRNRLAEAAAIAPATISRKMQTGDFTAPELYRIAKALGTSASALLAEAERNEVAA